MGRGRLEPYGGVRSVVTSATNGETLHAHTPSRARLSLRLTVPMAPILRMRVVHLAKVRGLRPATVARALIALGLEAVGRGCALTRSDASPLLEPGDIGS